MMNAEGLGQLSVQHVMTTLRLEKDIFIRCKMTIMRALAQRKIKLARINLHDFDNVVDPKGIDL
eukprot:9045414-Prorocentrum_lima.AAC.1